MTDPNPITPPLAAAIDALADRMANLESRQSALLSGVAGRRRRDAARLANVERELAADLGDQDPEVLRVRAQREANLALADRVASAVERARALAPAGTNGAAVVGSIQTHDGAHARNVVVRLLATSDKADTVVREVKTNRAGDFSIQVPHCEINPKATWKLVVQDDLGATLASEAVVVGGTKGYVPFVPLVLGEGESKSTPAKKSAPRMSPKAKG